MRSGRILGRSVGCSAIVLVLVAAGCTGGGGEEGSPTGAAKTGDTIRVAISEPVGVLNPQDYTGNHVVLTMIYEPLLRYGSDGSLEPGLAESYDASKDGLTYRFTLREGVEFQDGTPFDAEAAKFNLERWVGVPDHNWLGASNYIDTVDVVDPMTIELTLSRPYYPMLQELSLTRPVRFLSPESVGPDGEFEEPVGTGPWMLESQSDSGTVLTRNDGYWGEKPTLSRVEFVVIPDSQARVAALQAGDVDVLGGEYLAPLAPEDVQVLESDEGVQVLTEPGTTNLLLAFNTETGPLADADVRRAINMALDRESMATALYNGLADPATSVFPPVIPFAATSAESPTFDPDGSAQLLESAGWTGSPVRSKGGENLSFDLVLDPSSFPQARGLSEAIKAELADVGIEVKLRPLDSAGYGAAIVQDRDFDMAFFITYGAPYDPPSSLTNLFDSSTASDDGKVFTSPELDKLIQAALASTDESARDEDYQRIWSYMSQQAAMAPLLQQPRMWAVRSGVQGFELGATEYDLPLAGVTVAG